ncbi:MAG TPA: Uma2 family endonuclease [Pyrinomonadaceae bacterium]|jgi:Uma2 family endonuclease|nr:Uma2 family endonuclease [Pyrinomonadaceae bacterium]
MTQVLEQVERASVLVHMRPLFEMNDEQFEEFCRLNRDLRIEMTAEGDLLIMPPTFSRTGNRNFKLTTQLGVWTEKDGTGVGFDSSALFVLPNGAKRSPDASWVSKSRLASLTEDERAKFLPLCPDFVVELRSSSDSLAELHEKMREYMTNGARLGWLLDPPTRSVYIYGADGAIEEIKDAERVEGEPLLTGFVLDLQEIWQVGF